MNKHTLILPLITLCGTLAQAAPVVYLPFGTDIAGNLDGTWNAYARDTVGREFDAARAFAASTSFQPTYGTTNLPQGQLFGGAVAGNLVAVTTLAERDGVRGVSSGNGSYWIGLTDSTDTSSLDGFNYATLGTFETGGGGAGIASGGGDPGFRWVTGESAAFHTWNGGEPNDVGGEDAAEMLDNGLFNDLPSGPTLTQGSAPRASMMEYRVNVPASIITTIDAWKGTFYKSGSTQLTNLAQADALIGGFDLTGSATAYYTHMNLTENGGEGFFGGDLGIYGTNGADTEDYAFQGTGMLVVDSVGNYQFRTTSDDGARVRIDLNRDGDFLDPGELVINDDVLQGQGNQANSSVIGIGPGLYSIEYTWFERGGGAGGELSASMNGGAFIILGNDEGGGLNVVQIPEPSAAALGLLALAGLARRRRA
jgi:hypothetical protein